MKQMLLKILTMLGFAEKVQAKQELTTEEWASVAAAFEKEFGVSFEEAMKQPQTATLAPETIAAMQSVLGEPAQAANSAPQADPNAQVQTLVTTVQTQAQTIATLQAEPEPVVPKVAVFGATSGRDLAAMAWGGNHTPKHVFGIENPFFSAEDRWNRAAMELRKNTEPYSRAEREKLNNQFEDYSKQFAERYATLQRTGKLEILMAAGDIDYSDLDTAFHKRYLVRRMDTIITYLKKLSSIAQYFPIRYGVQDQEAITDSYIGRSFTQSYQTGRVFAGSHKFAPYIASVKKVMFKFKFHDLKDLENEYIGYLNREGSNPMKWTFIEWIMVQNSIKQFNEVEERRLHGVRVESTPTKAAFFKYASDGLLVMIEKNVDDVRAWRYSDLKTYNSTTILEYVRTFVRNVYRLKGNLNGMALYMNELDLPDFYEAYRNKYGSDNNYTGEKKEVKDFPLPKIVGLPNMGNSQYMFMCADGAVEFMENKAGEGYAYEYQRDLEELFVTSYKAEGTMIFAGRKFTDVATMVASKAKETNFFVNYPVTVLADGATTADAKVNNMFETIANTGATALTDFVDAVEGVLYTIVCGSLTNATTIAKANKFSTLTAAWTPTAVGDYLRVIYDPTTSKFYDYSRKVGGTITVNANLVAPEYVESI